MTTTEAHYLRDLGHLIRDEALRAKESAKGETSDKVFESGRLTAYYEVLSLMTQQAVAFGLPLENISLEGFDADSLLRQ